MKTADKRSGHAAARWAQSIGVAVLALAMGWAAVSQATVTTIGWWRLGEDDPGAAAGLLGQNPTVDIGGSGFNLTRVGSPTNRADAAPLQIPASTLSMQFNGSSSYATNVYVSALTTNIGMEIWAKPFATPVGAGLGGVIYNGNAYGIELTSSTNWEVRIGGVGVFPAAQPAYLNQWQHLGIVLTDGGGVNRLVRFYFEGVQVASLTLFVNSPTNIPNFAIGSLFGSSSFFNGELDNARVFTFTGAFDPRDFLIPEPSLVALLVLGGAMTFYASRRRHGR